MDNGEDLYISSNKIFRFIRERVMMLKFIYLEFTYLKLLNQYLFQIGVGSAAKYKIVLDSDAEEFGGHKLLDHSVEFFSEQEDFNGRPNSLMVRTNSCDITPFVLPTTGI